MSYRYVLGLLDSSNARAANADDVRAAARHISELGLFNLAERLHNLAGLLEEQEANVMTADEYADCQEASIKAQFGGDDA